MFKLPALIYKNKFALPSLPPAGAFKDQTVLITGASGGIGLATAVHFVNLGASSVIITARTSEKGEEAKNAIESQTNNIGKGIVKVMELDMSTFASTRTFAEQVKAEVKKIDVVLLNAGLLNRSFQLGKEGYEESIQVNALSTALLGLLLLPWLKEAGGGTAHLGFVTSGLHRVVPINEWPEEDVLGYFSKEENWPKPGMYPTSKLLEQYVVNEIAKLAVGRDGKSEVIVNPMCPGMVKSGLARGYKNNVLLGYGVDLFMYLVMKRTEDGARSLVLTATTTPEENGKYITHYQPDEDYKIAAEKTVFGPEGKSMQAEVWKEVLDVLIKAAPEVKEIARLKSYAQVELDP